MWDTSGSKEKYQINGLICQREPGTWTLWPIFKREGLQKWVSGLWTGLILKRFVNSQLYPSLRQTGGCGLTVTNWYTPHTQTCSREGIHIFWMVNLSYSLTTELNGTFGGRGNVSSTLLLVLVQVYFASHQHAVLVKYNIKLNLIKHDYHTVFVPVNSQWQLAGTKTYF